MTGSSKATDRFTILSPTNCDVSPTWKPPENSGSEKVRSERSRYNGNLHIYTDGNCLSSVDHLGIWTLTKTTGSSLWLDTLTGRTTLMKRPAERITSMERLKMNGTTQSSDTFRRVGSIGNSKSANRVALSITFCWGHAAPKAVAWRIPSKGKGGFGSPNRSSPVLHQI